MAPSARSAFYHFFVISLCVASLGAIAFFFWSTAGHLRPLAQHVAESASAETGQYQDGLQTEQNLVKAGMIFFLGIGCLSLSGLVITRRILTRKPHWLAPAFAITSFVGAWICWFRL